MASDWIKIEHALPNKPEVMHLADLLDIDQMQVVGHLVCFWCWCDQNLSLNCPQVYGTKKGIDRVAGRDGFADALLSVGWLKIENDQIVIPNYEHHLSQSAKQRALEAKKKKKQRERSPAKSPENVPTLTGQSTGPEKRREEFKEETSNEVSCSEPDKPDSKPAPGQKPPQNKKPPVSEIAEVVEIIFPTFPTNGDRKHWTLSPEKIQEYQQAFPGVDCQAEARKAWQWCNDNPTRRKTAKGMAKFLFSWFERSQNSGRAGASNGTNGTHKPAPQQFTTARERQDEQTKRVLENLARRIDERDRSQENEQGTSTGETSGGDTNRPIRDVTPRGISDSSDSILA